MDQTFYSFLTDGDPNAVCLRFEGRFLVNPLEIEEAVMNAAPEVAACVVVEVNAAGSTRPVAFVIGKPTYQNDETAIIAACKANLAIYKVPIRVFQVDDFPITPSPNGNKVKRNELRALAKARLATS